MINYSRTTRECSPSTMHPKLAAAIKVHIRNRGLEYEVEQSLMCIETTSIKQSKRLFRKTSETEINGVILTPQWLIWASCSEDKEPVVFSGPLLTLQVNAYEKSTMHAIVPDTGLNVTGFLQLENLALVFIGLGTEPAAQKFRNLLYDAIKKAVSMT